MVYDDGEDGVLYGLAEEFGPSILGVVLAHEFGHAIQARAGDLDRGLPTITTEQQADCFAGAWVARAADGEADGLTFTDAEVRTGLIAMITVRDPIGIDQFRPRRPRLGVRPRRRVPGRLHEGPARCAELIDDPLPLVPNTFQPGAAAPTATPPFGYGEGEIVGLITTDLNAFWPAALAADRAPRCRPSPSCRSPSADEVDVRPSRPATSPPARVYCADDAAGVLRRAAGPRPLRPLRRLRRRLHARRRPGARPPSRRSAARSPARPAASSTTA